ncbi:MAG TPA: hypothetical protein VLF93_01735 [Candidatus Saccharimonadales bacterium]|nr:hypothetical protein [Candidatus Saccharimonadales bacterium]
MERIPITYHSNQDPNRKAEIAFQQKWEPNASEQLAIAFLGEHPELMEKQVLCNIRNQVLALYDRFEQETGELDYLIAPAGGADIHPILLTKNLIIIDQVPFLNLANEDSQKIAKSISSKRKTFEQLIQDTQTQPALQRKIQKAKEQTLKHVLDRIPGGFEGVGKLTGTDEDNFTDIITSLGVIGIDLDTIAISHHKYGYTLSTNIQGKRKYIHYLQKMLPTSSGLRSKRERVQITQNILQDIPMGNRIGLLIKADMGNVGYSFMTMSPDVIILDKFIPYMEQDTDTYSFESIPRDPAYEALEFGYKDPDKPIEIAIIGRKS